VGKSAGFPKIKMIQQLDLGDQDYGFGKKKKLTKIRKNYSID
jgi:hypothetical protein